MHLQQKLDCRATWVQNVTSSAAFCGFQKNHIPYLKVEVKIKNLEFVKHESTKVLTWMKITIKCLVRWLGEF
jgi:hypothetical protein